MKGDFWNFTHIGLPDPDTEANDAVVLGFLVAQFIGEVRASLFVNVTIPLFRLRAECTATNKQTTIWRNFGGHSPVAGLTRLHDRCTKPKASLIPPLTWE